MGTKTRVSCQCGYKSDDILIGGGKLNFQYTHYYPCLCLDCKDVVQVNLKSTHECPNCSGANIVPYDDERLRGEYKEPKIRATQHHDVSKGFYYCPKCKKMNLKFLQTFYRWD